MVNHRTWRRLPSVVQTASPSALFNLLPPDRCSSVGRVLSPLKDLLSLRVLRHPVLCIAFTKSPHFADVIQLVEHSVESCARPRPLGL